MANKTIVLIVIMLMIFYGLSDLKKCKADPNSFETLFIGLVIRNNHFINSQLSFEQYYNSFVFRQLLKGLLDTFKGHRWSLYQVLKRNIDEAQKVTNFVLLFQLRIFAFI